MTVVVPPPSVSHPSHFADGMTIRVTVGDGASMAIVDPRHLVEHSSPVWCLTWGSAAILEKMRGTAASLIESYDYLLGPHISSAEAIRRLRILRATREAARKQAMTYTDHAQSEGK